MKNLIIILWLLLGGTSFAQLDNDNDSFRLIRIQGSTLDSLNNDTIRLATIEGFSGNQRIWTIRSDFNGVFIKSFCSKLLINNMISIKSTGVGYIQKNLRIRINSDTLITILMTKDIENKITFDSLKIYNLDKIFFEDYSYRIENEKLKKNPLYKHFCTNEIKSYIEIVNENLDFNNWIIIEK